MATNVVNTFDLYNTTNYWNGYNFPGYPREQKVTYAYHTARFSSNPIGSQIDFFREIAGNYYQNPCFSILSDTQPTSGYTIDSMPYQWGKFWWDKATYYSHPIVYSVIKQTDTKYYQTFSESVGSLYFLSYVNNYQNTISSCYNPIIESLLNIDINSGIKSFYATANDFFLANKINLGPGSGTDTAPGSGANGTLIEADTDMARMVAAVPSLVARVNSLYPMLSGFLPINTNPIGNVVTPYYWSLSADCEGIDMRVDFANRTIQKSMQLTTNNLKAI